MQTEEQYVEQIRRNLIDQKVGNSVELDVILDREARTIFRLRSLRDFYRNESLDHRSVTSEMVIEELFQLYNLEEK